MIKSQIFAETNKNLTGLLDSYNVNGIRQFPPNSARKKTEISYIHLINRANLANNSSIRLGKKRKETACCFYQGPPMTALSIDQTFTATSESAQTTDSADEDQRADTA